jgi:hypothetical protein
MSALIIMERRPYRRSERHGEGCEVRWDASPSGAEEGTGGGPTIVAVTALVSHRAANIVRLGFAVLGIVIKAIDDAGTAGQERPQLVPGRAARRGHQSIAWELDPRTCQQLKAVSAVRLKEVMSRYGKTKIRNT